MRVLAPASLVCMQHKRCRRAAHLKGSDLTFKEKHQHIKCYLGGFQAFVEPRLRKQQLETHAPAVSVGVPVVAQDAERAYLRRVVYVGTDAEAFIIIAHVHHTYRLAGVVRQAVQVEAALGFGLGDKFLRDVQMAGDDLVHGLFQQGYLFRRRRLGQQVVQLAFLAFDVRFYRASASEQTYHGLVYNVFTCMHGGDTRLLEFWGCFIQFHVVSCF